MYGLKGFGLRTLRISLTLFGLGIASSCALISTYVEAPDVEINTVSSTTVLVISAGLWMTGKRLSLKAWSGPDRAVGCQCLAILTSQLPVQIVKTRPA